MAVIRVENLTTEYRLATINNSTLRQVLQSCFARLRSKKAPNSLVTQNSALNAQQVSAHPSSLISQPSTFFCSSLNSHHSSGAL